MSTPTVDGALVRVRKQSVTLETVFHELGPAPERPLRIAAACAVVANPYAGRYVEDLDDFMEALRPLGRSLAEDLIGAMGGAEHVEAYGKAAVVGVDGELEHGAVWHVAGGWGMREVLGDPRAIVPSTKAVAATGYRLMVPLHHVDAAYVRSHYNSVEVGIQDAPRPGEILFALAVADGGRISSRLGGLTADAISVHDGQR